MLYQCNNFKRLWNIQEISSVEHIGPYEMFLGDTNQVVLLTSLISYIIYKCWLLVTMTNLKQLGNFMFINIVERDLKSRISEVSGMLLNVLLNVFKEFV